MNRSSRPLPTRPRFVVTAPFRTTCDLFARVFEELGFLRLYAVGTRRPTAGISPALTKLNPAVGLLSYIAAKTVGGQRAESFRFGLHPLLDHWVKRQLRPGDQILSSYGYANESFKWVKRHGGSTFIDAGNSHPEQFWEILSEEHRRWGYSANPVAKHHRDRSLAMLEHTDYIFTPSAFVADSFLKRGYSQERLLPVFYPVDLSLFSPRTTERPKGAPLRIINTGALSLRKGTPYLFEAFRLFLKQEPDARLLLNRNIDDSMKGLMERYADLPIDWTEGLDHRRLGERLRSGDIFVLPSLEEGLARTSVEAMACGLPVIVTPNTGSNDYVTEGVNGSVVPIRDPAAIANALSFWGAKIRSRAFNPATSQAPDTLRFDAFKTRLSEHLKCLGADV